MVRITESERGMSNAGGWRRRRVLQPLERSTDYWTHRREVREGIRYRCSDTTDENGGKMVED